MKIEKCEKCAMDVTPGWFFASDGCAVLGCPVRARHDEQGELEFSDWLRSPRMNAIVWPVGLMLVLIAAVVVYLIGGLF